MDSGRERSSEERGGVSAYWSRAQVVVSPDGSVHACLSWFSLVFGWKASQVRLRRSRRRSQSRSCPLIGQNGNLGSGKSSVEFSKFLRL